MGCQIDIKETTQIMRWKKDNFEILKKCYKNCFSHKD